MDNKELKRIYRIEAPGLEQVITKVQQLSQELALQKAIKKEASKVLLANPNDARVMEQQTRIIGTAELAIKKLSAEKRLAVKEGDLLIKTEERLAGVSIAQANAANHAAGSINEAAAAYKALLGLTRNAGADGLINWKGETIGIEDAKKQLNGYKKTVDDFNRSLSPDGTLVGEYKTGIINAFKDLGLTDLLKDQKFLLERQISDIIDKQKTLVAHYHEVKREGPAAFERIIPEIESNIAHQRTLEAQLDDINQALKRNGGTGVAMTKAIGNGFSNLIRTGLGVLGLSVGLQQIGNLISKSFNVNTKIDSMNSALKLVSRTEVELTKNQDFLREETERLGLELLSTTTAFKSFYTASTQSGIGANTTRDIFDAVASSAANLKLSQDDVNGVFTAFGQIASKGKVQAEELRGQIGERIPGAFSIAARAIGVTEEKLNKMLEKGEVIATDFLPKFAVELRKTFGGDAEKQIDGLQAATNRFQNALTKLFESDGAREFYASILNESAEVLNYFSQGAKTAKDYGKEIAEVSDQTEKYQGQIGPLLSRYDELKRKTNLNAQEQAELKNIISELAAIVPGAVTEFDLYGNALDVNKEKVLSFAEANDKMAAGLRKSTLAELNKQANQLLKTNTDLNKVINQGFVEKNVGGAGGGSSTFKDALFNADGSATEAGKEIAKTQKEVLKSIQNTVLEIVKAGGTLTGQMQQFISGSGAYKVEILQRIQAINEDIDKKTTAASKAFLNGDEATRKKLADEIKALKLERQKLLDPTSVDGPAKPGGLNTTNTEDAAKKRLEAAKKELERRLREVDLAFLEQQTELYKQFYRDNIITEEQYQQRLYDVTKAANERKQSLIAESIVGEKTDVVGLQLEQLKADEAFENLRFENRKKAIERLRDQRLDAAQDEANAVLNDPATSPRARAEAELKLANDRLEITTDFNASMDILEKRFTENSVENARERANAVVELEKAKVDAQSKITAEGFKEQLNRIRTNEVADVVKTTLDLEKQVDAILGGSKSPKQKAEAIEKVTRDANLRILDSSISADTQELEVFRAMVDAKIKTEEEFEQFRKNLIDKRIQRNEQAAQKEIEAERKKQETKDAIVQAGSQVVDQFLTSMFDAQNARIEQESEIAVKRLENEKASALAMAQSTQEKESIEKQFAAKRREVEKQEFDKKKEQRKKEIAIEMAFGIAKAFAQNPPPSPLGFIGAAALVLQAAIQVAAINRQQFKLGGEVPRNGGRLSGPSHAEGGIPFNYEAEGGELFVINKNSARMNRRFSVSGTPQEIASAINVIGGGVAFRPGATLRRLEYGGSLGASLRAPVNAAKFLNDSGGSGADKSDIANMMAIMIEMNQTINGRIDRIAVVNDPRASLRAQNKVVQNDNIGSL